MGNPFLQFIQSSELHPFYWGMKNANWNIDNLKISHITLMPQSNFALCLSASKFVYRPNQIHFRHTCLRGLKLEADGRKENAAADDRRNIKTLTTYRSTSVTKIRNTGWGSFLFGKRDVIAIFFKYLICLQALYWQNTFVLYTIISALYQWSQDELEWYLVLRDHFPGDPWIYFWNGYFEVYLFFK